MFTCHPIDMNAGTTIRPVDEIAAHERGELKLNNTVVATPAIDVA